MDNSVIQCIKIRTDFFENYYTVPDAARADVDAFCERLNALGEGAADAQDFEAKFAAEGMQESFNALLLRCTPKPYKMSAEEKAAARETAKQETSGGQIIKDIAEDTLDYASVMAKEELIALKRKAMIEEGVFDEHTRATNAAEFVKDVGGGLWKLFKKK